MAPPRQNLFLVLACALWLGAGGLTASPARAIESAAKQVILIDDSTGTLLFEKNADERMPPASMLKLMTVYMVFERLAEGSLELDETLAVSEKAWRTGGSKMFVRVNTRVAVEDLLRGIIVQSGNDACVVVAEALAGSEAAFAQEMTQRGRAIGLEDSEFRNATGWPDPEQYMTARDVARLAIRIIHDFPQYYRYFKEKNFTYNEIRQGNRNPLLYKEVGADGLKTGHTQDSGYGLAASAERKGRRLVLVVNGLDSVNQRARESERLLDWGFREFKTYKMFSAGETVVEADTWLGDSATVPLVLEQDFALTLARKVRRGMKATVIYDGPIAAPIAKGAEVGKLVITAPETKTVEVPLVAGAEVGRLGTFKRLGAALGYLVWGAAGR
jgi:D-alanyl-D-alanine carboxypeptidase (penicillin-binding protein 5/6)